MPEQFNRKALLQEAARQEIRRREELLPLFSELPLEISEALWDVFTLDEAAAESIEPLKDEAVPPGELLEGLAQDGEVLD